MRLMRAATLTVSDLPRSQALYCHWLDYAVVEAGTVSDDLAKSWGAPKTVGAPYSVLQPASGLDIFIRLIEQPEHKDYRALRTYGWAAIEICTQDTLAVNARMERSPFEIIGPPKALDGVPTIFPMQVKGPDQEIVYLTEIKSNLPDYDLPRAQSPIDSLFILVMACSDMAASGDWLERHLKISKGSSMNIIYSMINTAFDLPADTKHDLMTFKHERDVFLEIDRYPTGATARPQHAGWLPPCAAIGSFIHPDFEALETINQDIWITPPSQRDGAVYKGKKAGTVRTPDNTLIEIIEA